MSKKPKYKKTISWNPNWKSNIEEPPISKLKLKKKKKSGDDTLIPLGTKSGDDTLTPVKLFKKKKK